MLFDIVNTNKKLVLKCHRIQDKLYGSLKVQILQYVTEIYYFTFVLITNPQEENSISW